MARDGDFDGIDIRQELRAARSEPTEEFTSRLVDRVGAERPHQRPRLASRAALAFAMTVAALAVAAAFGGISEAALTVERAVSSVVNVGHKAKPHPAVTTNTVTRNQARSGGGSAHGRGVRPPAPTLPSSPSGDQYVVGCTTVPRSQVNCHLGNR